MLHNDSTPSASNNTKGGEKMQEEKFYSTKKAAEFLNINVRTFQRLRQAGKISPDKTGTNNSVFYSETQLKKYSDMQNMQSGDTSGASGDTSGDTSGDKVVQVVTNEAKNSENAQSFIISQVVNTPSVELSENLPVHRDNPTDSSFKNLPPPQPQYSKILQGKCTNAITKQSKKTLHYNNINDTADIVTSDGVRIYLQRFQSLNLNVNTYKVLDACVVKLTKNFPHGDNISLDVLDKHRTLTFSVDEYMQMCHIKDRKQAFEQLRDAVRTLYNLTINGTEVRYIIPRGKTKLQRDEWRFEARLLEFIGEAYYDRPIVDGYVELHFSMDMAKYFSRAYLMPYPNGLLIINGKHNPHSYFIGRKLAEHHNMNIGKSNSNRIAVKSLIDALPDLPKREQVMKGNRNLTQQIIQPFERDLIALKDSYGMLADWHYCQLNGELLTDEQIESYSFNEWSAWLIDFTFANYPDQSDRIQKISDFKNNKSQKRKKSPLKATKSN